MPWKIAKLSWKLRWLLAVGIGLSAPYLFGRLQMHRAKLTHCGCDSFRPFSQFSIFDAYRSLARFTTLMLGSSPTAQSFIVLLLCLTTAVTLQRWRYKSAIKRLAVEIEKSPIPASRRAQYLLTCLNAGSVQIRQNASTELAAILPSLNSSDFEYFDSAARKSLHKMLNHLDYTVVLGALHALSNVGNRRDVRAVRRLLRGQPLSTSDIRVKHAARDCLQQIQERIDNRSDKRILLRTAESDPAALMCAVN